MNFKMGLSKKAMCYSLAATILTGVGMPQIKISAAENYFNENFENGYENWNIEKGKWSIINDNTKIFNQENTSIEGRAFRGDNSWTSYSVEADIKVSDFNGSNRALLAGRCIDANNYYAVSLVGKNGGTVELRKKVNGSSSVISKVNMLINVDTWYNVKLDMNGSEIKVYIDNNLVIEANDTSLSNGAVGLISNKVAVSYDNIIVRGIDGGELEIPDESPELGDEEAETPNNQPEIEDTEAETPDNSTGIEDSQVSDLSRYSVEGFSYGNKGGGVIDENSEYYVKVTNAAELGQALKKKSKIKVIEIANDINLGWNEIPSEARVAPFSQNITPLTHPTLKETGVSKLTVDSFDGLTIFSKNGSKLTHAGIVFKNCKNVVIRNVEFDELWEWDESTKGNYDRNDWDYITLENCHKVWIDHCTFGKAYDGIVDSKKGTTGLTISWSKFLSGDSNVEFFNAMFDEMEKNRSQYPMYNFIRNQGMSKNDIMKVSSPQKKTHLIGAIEQAEDNSDLEITLHHNYYKNSQDRMPRLRGGNAHIYNIVMDSEENYETKKLISSSVEKAIKNAGYHLTITSNGALSTEGGALLMENSQILGVMNPLKNNQKDAAKSNYTGKIKALNTIYECGKISFKGDSTSTNSPLSPEPAKSINFAWNGMSNLPYTYDLDEPEYLKEMLLKNAGADRLDLSTENWLKTTY